jgi:hypothetical protein
MPRILYNLKFHFAAQKIPPLVPILRQLHILTPSFFNILIVSTHPLLGLPSGLLPSGFPTTIFYAIIIYLYRAYYMTISPPKKLIQAVTPLIRIRQVPASNLGRDTDYSDVAPPPPSSEMTKQYLKLCNNSFLFYHFQFSVH